jgi:ketosteroid isomerase-like protein
MAMPRTRAKTTIFPTPADAANAFYEAFEARDIEAMMAVWAEDEEIICVHPGGPRLVGYAAVRASWTELFAGETRLRLHLSGPLLLQTIAMAVQSVTEQLTFGEESESRGSVEATNIFLQTPVGWRMLAHHASPSNEGATLPAIPQGRLH